MGDSLVINMWCGPRNVSTALMYSWRQRSDTRVVDEPLYGHYLSVSDAVHPGQDEVLAAMDRDGDRVMRELLASAGAPVLFLKQMTHHLIELDRGFLRSCRNGLLVRDPREMLPSLVNQLPNPTLRDTGLKAQAELLQELLELGQAVPVIDSRELLRDPPGVLAGTCEAFGLEFEPAMLSWPAGAKEEDGVWAPHWYHRVHETTGFAPYSPKTTAFPEALEPLLEECLPYYEQLRAHVIPTRSTS